MREAVIVEALRTPIAKGKPVVGELTGFHPTELFASIMDSLIDKAGIGYEMVEQVVGGCVTQAGEQAGNVARYAWLTRGKGYGAGGTTVDVQCGSSQQANHIIASFVKSGSIDVGIAGGIEVMSHVGLGANVMNGPGFWLPSSWPWGDETLDQFTAAERISRKRGITREDVDAFGLRSQTNALRAQSEGRFDREISPIMAPVIGEDGQPTGDKRLVDKDQGIRKTDMDALAKLKPVKDGGIHTAGTSAQVSDGACAILWMTAEKAKSLGLRPRARIIQDVVVGTDPKYLLEGPIDATHELMRKTGMTLSDIDLFEINEAFAAVALAWLQAFDADIDKLNVNGGAIALGHPAGATGARLITTALHELERVDKNTALISMCCGASVGTGTIIERL